METLQHGWFHWWGDQAPDVSTMPLLLGKWTSWCFFDCSVSSISSCLIPSLYHIFSCFFFVLPLVARIYPCLSFRGLKTGTSNAWTMNIVSQHFGRRTYGKNMRKYSHYICSSYHHHYIQNQKTISPPYPHDIGLGIPHLYIYKYILYLYIIYLYVYIYIYMCIL